MPVLLEVHRERAAQDARWGQQDHPDGTGPKRRSPGATAAAASETENDIVAIRLRHRCNRAFAIGNGTWEAILSEEYAEALAEEDPARLRTELLQVAAVCVAWVEAIDRRKAGP